MKPCDPLKNVVSVAPCIWLFSFRVLYLICALFRLVAVSSCSGLSGLMRFDSCPG